MVVSRGPLPQQTPKSRADRPARLSVAAARAPSGRSEAAPLRQGPVGLVTFRAGSMSRICAEIVPELMRAISKGRKRKNTWGWGLEVFGQCVNEERQSLKLVYTIGPIPALN